MNVNFLEPKKRERRREGGGGKRRTNLLGVPRKSLTELRLLRGFWKFGPSFGF